MKALLCKALSLIISFVSVVAWHTGQATFPDPTKRIDLEDFTLTFEDEFDGELDRNIWSGHYTYGDISSVRKGSYWNNNMPYTQNGSLVIPMRYLPDGMGGTGAGWYTAGLDTSGRNGGAGFLQRYGYFECRCILPKGCADAWGAFWMINEQVFNADGDGQDGTEVDVFESFYYNDSKISALNNKITANIHFDGYGEAHQSQNVAKVYIKGNPYEEYNTYGVEWNENEYIFYLNGMEYARSDFGGVCKNPLYMILSVELWGENAVPERTAEPVDFIIDYVRVYQYNDIINAK